MKLLANEEILLESEPKALTLTNCRVRYDSTKWGKAHLISIFLEQISSCGIRSTSYPLILIIAGLVFLTGFFPGEYDAVVSSIIIAAILNGIYFITRHQVISIESSGKNIEFNIKGMGYEKAKGFLTQLEGAKYQRVTELNT